MFEFLKSTFKQFDGQKKKSEDRSAAEDTQSSSQDEVNENRDIFVDPVIKRLKEAKVNARRTFSMPCLLLEITNQYLPICIRFCRRTFWIYTM